MARRRVATAWSAVKAARRDGALAAMEEVFVGDGHGEDIGVRPVEPRGDALARVDVHAAEVDVGVAVVDDGFRALIAVDVGELRLGLDEERCGDLLFAEDGDHLREIQHVASRREVVAEDVDGVREGMVLPGFGELEERLEQLQIEDAHEAVEGGVDGRRIDEKDSLRLEQRPKIEHLLGLEELLDIGRENFGDGCR